MPRGFYRGMLVALLAILQAIFGALGMSRSTLEETDEFRAATRTIQFDLHASEGMTAARLRVHVQVKAGGVTWKLIDPEGQVRLTGEGESGNITTDTGDMEPLPGTWVLELRMRQATGRYRFAWEAA